MIKKFLLFSFLIFLVSCGAASWGLHHLIVVEPGEEIDLKSIKRILGKESNIFYSDGVTKIGVIFDETHRQYVEYKDIPKYFVDALVSAEDENYFQHFGFDPAGIARAMIKNIEAGRIVQGGSTLTQQTAKNLFKRKDRSIEEKLKELLFALRLEYRYSKEQIFEFYANQFYVSGNGHGLGVAARYYFDKTPKDLTVVECAFIAGSVKRPNYYNPFIKKSQIAIDLTKERATTRLEYVLDKMLENGKINQYQHSLSLQEGIPFKKGQFGYEFDTVMDMVADAVDSDVLTEDLRKHGIDNIATSGVNIITTIDKDIQETSLYSLRRQLSILDTKLRGYNREEVQEELKVLNYGGDVVPIKRAFVFGDISNIEIKEEGKEKTIQIEVDLGLKYGSGFIYNAGLKRIVSAKMNWHKGKWGKLSKKDTTALLNELKVGDKVWASVANIDDKNIIHLNLEKYPKIQGGTLVRHNGQIISAVGGTNNKDFNRALYAKRTMGSSFKPLVYAAAMQLGWTSADPIDNRRNVFVYQRLPYFPRPDHKSPFDWVSINMAGIKSENLASIWILYHLTDKLDNSQLFDLADKLGFTPQTKDGHKESYDNFSKRMRDKYGISVNKSTLKEVAFQEAVDNIETDLIFEGLEHEYSNLQHLNYGENYELFYKQIQAASKNKSLTGRERAELQNRKVILSSSFLNAGLLLKDLENYKDNIIDDDPFGYFTEPIFSKSNKAPFVYRSLLTGKYHFGYNKPDEDNYVMLNTLEVKELSEYRIGFWQNIILGEMITPTVYRMIKNEYQRQYKKYEKKAYYSFNTLAKVPDYRITVGLYYLINLAKEMGVSSELAPVLSFPLGSNVVTLLEIVKIYEAMVTGSSWRNTEEAANEQTDMLGIIARIETEKGVVCYEANTNKVEVVDKKTSLSLGNILENVVRHGTGYRANTYVKLTSEDPKVQSKIKKLKLRLPLLGKTGTANDYTNAAFIGYLPGLNTKDSSLTIENGYSIGAYVGFDNNMPMKHKNIRISGAAGTLTTWSDIVNEIISSKKYADNLDLVDISFEGISIKREDHKQKHLVMDLKNGGLLVTPHRQTRPSASSILTFISKKGKKRLIPKGQYQPFWANQDSNKLK
ncbi:MAG: transglycosylase domain-containing protein [Desulfotalea sp.]